MRLFLCSLRLGPRPELLVELMGGTARRDVAVILNASDHEPRDRRAASAAKDLAVLRAVGLEPHVVDLRDHFDRALGRDHFTGFGAVYLKGGSLFVLNRALRQSGADVALRERLADDSLVWAGYSAGACVLSGALDVYESDGEDDPGLVPRGYERTPSSTAGLSVLPFWIAPHYEDDPAAPTSIYPKRLESHGKPWVPLRDDEVLVYDGHRYVLHRSDGRESVQDLPAPRVGAPGQPTMP